MKTNESGDTVIESKLEHNHEKEQNIMVRLVIRNSLKRKAQDDICEQPLKLIHHDLKDINTDTLNKTDMNCFRKSIYLARRSKLLAILFGAAFFNFQNLSLIYF